KGEEELSRTPLITLLVFVPAYAATLTAAGTAEAKAPATSSGVVSNTAKLSPDVARTVKGSGVGAYQQALARYWTPARMQAAKPDSELPAVKAAAAGSSTGRSGSLP